jgi:hypothetical protein
VGTAYSQTLTATGTAPAWSIDSGSLPTGLSLAANGAITGMPTVASTFDFTVKAENALGSDTKALSIVIKTVLPPADFIVTNTEEWEAALTAITNSTPNKAIYVIEVKGNVPVSSSNNSFGSRTNITVTLCGNGKLYLNNQGNMIQVKQNQTLVIESKDLTLEGLKNGQNGATQDNNAPVVYIDGGTLTLNDGKISGNTNPSLYSPAIIGGGVSVYNSGTFTMTGGTISGNTASTLEGGRGGGVEIRDGSFTMTGGTIFGNTGRGVFVWHESPNPNNFTMNGGTISNNTASGVYVSGCNFTMNGGAISNNTASGGGGGVSVRNGIFTMNNGEISNNTAYSSITGGGGVLVNSSVDRVAFIMNGGTISNNTATSSQEGGGGVTVYNGGFTMTGGTISGNTAEGRGGGVWTRTAFTMSGGTISGNTAKYYGGGGVLAESDFTMSGNAAITDNISATSGGGVYIRFSPNFIMNDNATISGNKANGTVLNWDNATGIYGTGHTFLTCGGGGVLFTGNNFIMNGGKIFGNYAERGGGIYAIGVEFSYAQTASWRYVRITDGIIVGSTPYTHNGTVLAANSANSFATYAESGYRLGFQHGKGSTWTNITTNRSNTIHVEDGVLK